MTPSDPSDPPGPRTRRAQAGDAPVLTEAPTEQGTRTAARKSRVRRSTRTASTAPLVSEGAVAVEQEALPRVSFSHEAPPREEERAEVEVDPEASAEPVPPRYAVTLDEEKIDPDVQKV